jgi:hypothetical protein
MGEVTVAVYRENIFISMDIWSTDTTAEIDVEVSF